MGLWVLVVPQGAYRLVAHRLEARRRRPVQLFRTQMDLDPLD